MADLNLKISNVADSDQLLEDTQTLAKELRDFVDSAAQIPTTQSKQGERAGSAVLLGEIALAVVTSGAAAALLDVLKGYFGRRRSAEIMVTRADGAVFSIKSEQLTKSEFDATLSRAEAFLRIEK